MYAPLRKDRDKFVEVDSAIEPTAWLDEGFVRSFQNQLSRYFKLSLGTVVMKGAEFSNCRIYEPKGITDYYYVEIHDGSPVRSASEEYSTDAPKLSQTSADSLRKELTEVEMSEKFYEELWTTLTNNYLLPNYAFESEPEQQLISTVDLLRHPRLLIIGPAGSGKTSLVRRLTFDIDIKFLEEPESERLICFYFKLRDFDNNASDLQKAISQKEDSIGAIVPAKASRGQLLYIFDGLDELNADRRSGFAKWLSGFLKGQMSVRTIITSRETSITSTEWFEDFRKIIIQPFTTHQIYEYCYRYFGSKTSADSFYDKIVGNSSLSRLLSNPLTLSLALAIYAVRKILPYNTGELIRELVVQLTERWDEKRGIRRYRLLSARVARSLLGRLAYRLQYEGNFTFDEGDLANLIPFEYNEIPKAAILREIREATGLLRYEDNRWSFSHRYFQDFFCANYLIERVGGIQDEFSKFSSDANWATVWRYVGELCSDPEMYIGFAGHTQKGPIYPVDKLMAILLSEDKVGSDVLVSLLDVIRKNLKPLSNELQGIIFRKKRITLVLKKSASSAPEILSSFLLGFYHLSKLYDGEIAGEIFRAARATKFGGVLKRIMASEQVPKISVRKRRVEIDLHKSEYKS